MKTFVRIWLGIGLIAIGLGIALLILAAASGATWRDVTVPAFSLQESYSDVKSLDIQIAYGEIYIKEGKEFAIDAKNLVNDSFKSYVKDDTWVIREESNSRFHLFGVNLPYTLWWGEALTPKITITVPYGFKAEEMSLRINAGILEADRLLSDYGSFWVDAGELKVRELQVDKESSYNVGAGQMVLKDIKVNNITVDCKVGSIVMQGVIVGDNTITNGIGQIDVKINGNREDYSYRIDSGIGSVIINEDSYKNISSRKIYNKNAQNNLNLESGIGHISVKFN